MGVVLNRPSETAVEDVASELSELVVDEPVFIGESVQPQALVVLAEFNDPEAAAWIVAADVGFVSTRTEYDDLARAIRRGRVYASCWAGAPDSSSELARTLDRRAAHAGGAFPDDPLALWQDVLARKGGQFALIARMPDDPSLRTDPPGREAV